MTKSNQPIHKIRCGAVHAAIWQNAGSSGPFLNATFERVYKDGDSYRSTDSYAEIDTAVLASVAHAVTIWMAENRPERERIQEAS